VGASFTGSQVSCDIGRTFEALGTVTGQLQGSNNLLLTLCDVSCQSRPTELLTFHLTRVP
jgi:hypothetical protein